MLIQKNKGNIINDTFEIGTGMAFKITFIATEITCFISFIILINSTGDYLKFM
jgi:hypothetical protein